MAKKLRVYDTANEAIRLRRTFTDKPVKHETSYDFSWPTVWQNIGDSLAVAYASDKWKKDGDFELYKHLAESRNRIFALPGADYDFGGRKRAIGPMVDFTDVPLPKDFAVLASLEELNLRLYTRGTNDAPRFGVGNEGVEKITVKGAVLGASYIRWDKVGAWRKKQPFLFVFTEDDGPLFFIVGEELDVEKDGIVG